jgi:HAMP domain-containing protein
LALGYCITFDYRFLFGGTPGLDVNDAYYLLLPVGTLLIVIIFLRRSLHFSIQAGSTGSHPGHGGTWQHLIRPQGEEARVLRNLAFALSLAFLPGLQTFFGFPHPYGFILSNIGSILAIIAIALVYFNYAPEVDSFMAKLVGITLASVLLIFAIFGAVDIYSEQSAYSAARSQVIASIHDALLKAGPLIPDPPQVAYIVSWKDSKPGDAGTYRQIYRADNEVNFSLDLIIDENRKGYLETWSRPESGTLAQLANDEFRTVQRYWTYPLGSGQEDYQSYLFDADGTTYEIGFSSTATNDYFSTIVSKWLILILVSSAFVLLVFPLFFRRTLVEPLNNLLDGITRVNQGNLDTVIPISFNDEIGFLT